MNRELYIMEALDVNRTKAQIINAVIKDIPDNKLQDFFVFRMQYLAPYKSPDVATKEALADYQRLVIRSQLRRGVPIFSTPEAVLKHLQTFYRGRDVANGPACFFDYVVIAMNKDGELVNKYRVNEHGNFSRLSGEDCAEVIRWLYENQDRIGDVKIVQEREPVMTLDRIEAPDYIPDNEISADMKDVITLKNERQDSKNSSDSKKNA